MWVAMVIAQAFYKSLSDCIDRSIIFYSSFSFTTYIQLIGLQLLLSYLLNMALPLYFTLLPEFRYSASLDWTTIAFDFSPSIHHSLLSQNTYQVIFCLKQKSHCLHCLICIQDPDISCLFSPFSCHFSSSPIPPKSNPCIKDGKCVNFGYLEVAA